jgi:putative heme transporter
LYAGNALASAVSAGVVPGALAGGVAIAVVVLFAAVRTGNREGTAPNGRAAAVGVPPGTDFSLRHPYRTLQRIARTVPNGQCRSVADGNRFGFSNWLTDLACLLAPLRAVGLAVPVSAAATAYMAIQLIRQIPATPGGVGLVEASLFLARTATGVGHAPGAAAIIIYRVLSCWAILPIGLMCWFAGNRPASALDHDACP